MVVKSRAGSGSGIADSVIRVDAMEGVAQTVESERGELYDFDFKTKLLPQYCTVLLLIMQLSI